MATISVQFFDSAETAIAAVFCNAQDLADYPNQAQIDSSDARYAAYFAALPLLCQRGMPTPG